MPQNSWDSGPPTVGQLDFLRKQGIDISGIKYKGMAQKLVGRVLARLQLKLASAHQLSFLKQLGMDDQKCATLSAREASVLIDKTLAEKKSRDSDGGGE